MMDFLEEDPFISESYDASNDLEDLARLIYHVGSDDLEDDEFLHNSNILNYFIYLLDGTRRVDRQRIPDRSSMCRGLIRARFTREANMNKQIERYQHDRYWMPWFEMFSDDVRTHTEVPLQVVNNPHNAVLSANNGMWTYGRLIAGDSAQVLAVYYAGRSILKGDVLFSLDVYQDYIIGLKVGVRCRCISYGGTRVDTGVVTAKTTAFVTVRTKRNAVHNVAIHDAIKSSIWLFPLDNDNIAVVSKRDIFTDGKVHVTSQKLTMDEIWERVGPSDVAESILIFGLKPWHLSAPRTNASLHYINGAITEEFFKRHTAGRSEKCMQVPGSQHHAWHAVIHATNNRKKKKKMTKRTTNFFVHDFEIDDAIRITGVDGIVHDVLLMPENEWMDVSPFRYGSHVRQTATDDLPACHFSVDNFQLFHENYSRTGFWMSIPNNWRRQIHDAQSAGTRSLQTADLYELGLAAYDKLFQTVTWTDDNTTLESSASTDQTDDNVRVTSLIDDDAYVRNAQLLPQENAMLRDHLTCVAMKTGNVLARLHEFFRKNGVQGIHNGLLDAEFVSKSWWKYARPLVLNAVRSATSARKLLKMESGENVYEDDVKGRKLRSVLKTEFANMENGMMRVACLMMAGLISCAVQLSEKHEQFSFAVGIRDQNAEPGASVVREVLGKNDTIVKEFSTFNRQALIFAKKLLQDKESRLAGYAKKIEYGVGSVSPETTMGIEYKLKLMHSARREKHSGAQRMTVEPNALPHDNYPVAAMRMELDDVKPIVDVMGTLEDPYFRYRSRVMDEGLHSVVTSHTTQRVQKLHQTCLSYLSSHGKISVHTRDQFMRMVTKTNADNVSGALRGVLLYDTPHWLLHEQPNARVFNVSKQISRLCIMYKTLIDNEPDSRIRASTCLRGMLHCIQQCVTADEDTHEVDPLTANSVQHLQENLVMLGLKNNTHNVCAMATMLYERGIQRMTPLDQTSLRTRVIKEYQSQRESLSQSNNDSFVIPRGSTFDDDDKNQGRDASFFGIF